MLKYTICAALMVQFGLSPAIADEVKMGGKELSELLSAGKNIRLGGPGTGYSGELVLTSDGRGNGQAKTDDGTKTFVLEGTWRIKGDEFCRQWAAFDDGNEVCETWVLIGTKQAKVVVGDDQIGINSWD
ncbi:hypothetical protein [Chelativorans salis]|uniref:Dihydrodipicolinate reductase n=1 Tax=Chelativorans salis TaxID=2978478 RepID=A0ABT2LS65_9HYPH|nr:hypothetical protein [Chelativorans sp. EGI FJ00035]MCT7377304.1 hypothetical protein [Chelativorans sp. EGI FJ00035]